MDPDTLKVLSDLLHTGGSGAIFALVYVGFTIARHVRAAHDTLKRIEQRMVDDRETLRLAVKQSDMKLDSIHADLLALPLQLARQRRLSE